MVPAVIAIIAVALVFDFINGFHDAANSIATVVTTRVLSPVIAVGWAAFFNFIAAAPVLFGRELHVANTMGKGIIQFEMLRGLGSELVLTVIFAALAGAIFWNLLTWWWGLPSSSSHALAGGMIGATLPALGMRGLVVSGIVKIAAFIVLSPIIGMVLGSINMVGAAWIVRKQTPARVDRWFRRLQLLSASVFSYSHSTNDAQKVMGIIAVVLYGTIWAGRPFRVPVWVVFLCHTAIAAGTFFGGWRIVKTMGSKLTRLQPVGGSAPRLEVGSPSSPWRSSASRCRLLTPSPARSLAWARPGGRARCAGASREGSSGPGSSPSLCQPCSALSPT